jgi:arylsulfatase A-like enzyme
MSDNQPADLLGCYGNDEVHTPHIDALAKRGTRFENAFCVNAMCSPCRASVLTGLMPSQHGVHNWLDDQLMGKWADDWSAIGEFNTLPGLLKSAGYDTALIGKYHLGMPFKPQLGFDHWVTFPHGHTHNFYGNEVIDGDRRYQFSGHSVDFFTDKTVDYIETRANQNTPFFAFVPFNGPYGHWPAIKGRAANQFAELYDDADMHSVPREGIARGVVERYGMRVQEGGLREQFKGPLLLPNNMEALRNYFSQVSLVDHGVGRIVQAIDQFENGRETIVIYTADHGFSLGHNGIWGHGLANFPSSAHRPSYNIPLVMAGGGIAQSQAHSGLVSQLDLFPTLAKFAGIDAAPSLPSAARDLSPALNGDLSDGHDVVFMEQEETRAIRTKDWLYVHRFAHAPSYPIEDELYDLTADPDEKNNLIGSADHAELAHDMRAKIDAFFDVHAVPEFDLWHGGTAKSNASFAPFWQDAWGANWKAQ